jgi:hypothetical protein
MLKQKLHANSSLHGLIEPNPRLLDLSFMLTSMRELQQDDLDTFGRLLAPCNLYLKVAIEISRSLGARLDKTKSFQYIWIVVKNEPTSRKCLPIDLGDSS